MGMIDCLGYPSVFFWIEGNFAQASGARNLVSCEYSVDASVGGIIDRDGFPCGEHAVPAILGVGEMHCHVQ